MNRLVADSSPSRLGARLRRGDALRGALLRMPNEALVELSGLVGLDFVVIDTEHGPADQLALAHHITAAQATGLAVIVRIGHVGEILRVLDLGAAGILAPHVCSVSQARELVEAAHYPPRGVRGFASNSRAAQYGLTPGVEHHAASRDTVVIAMIEDPAGLAAAADIAAVEGVDGLMLGPADLACELGVVGSTDDPRVLAAAATVRECAHAAGRAAVTIVAGPDAARREFTAGANVVVFNVSRCLADLFTELAAVHPGDARAADADSAQGREPLLLLSGMLGDASVWDGVTSALVDVAAVQTCRIDLDDSVAEMAASVLAEAPEQFAVAGHSLGAIVALEILRQAPGRVTRVALLNASGRGPSAAQLTAWAEWSQATRSGRFGQVAAELARLTLPMSRRDDEDLVARNQRMAYTVGPDAFLRQLTAQANRPDSLASLAAIEVPVLVISAALDEVCPPALQLEIAKLCSTAHVVSIPDAGHMSPLERPDAVAGHLRHWLTRKPATASVNAAPAAAVVSPELLGQHQ